MSYTPIVILIPDEETGEESLSYIVRDPSLSLRMTLIGNKCNSDHSDDYLSYLDRFRYSNINSSR